MFDQDFSLDDSDLGGGGEVSGEVGLALAIIGQALRDAFGSTITRDKAESQRQNILAESIRFLLAETGEWRESRENICAIADIDSEWLRRKAAEMYRRACESDREYAERMEEADVAYARRQRQKVERERKAAERKAAEPELQRQKAERHAERAARRAEKERLAAERKAERERLKAEREAEQRRQKQAQYARQHRERVKDPNWTPREPMSDEARAARRKETVKAYNAKRLAKMRAGLQSSDPQVRAAAAAERDRRREIGRRCYAKKKARKRERAAAEPVKVESILARRLLGSTCMTSWRLAA